ncbi:indolepyruvate ferredoxin oxidoreductase family protein [Corynebacterium ulceribovis]|uniref:indolepyruvate ferredoxin oxidoreductase family protein n=1 Tax=Corynebacterium ulceribovis TaxID=487732 RepID=UPI000372AB0F|nr:indolepyruvate ferredoxin oxidoreductase family protein [Corynebacterium ulceribovis]
MTTMLNPSSREENRATTRATKPAATNLIEERLTDDRGAVQLTGIQALVRMIRDRALSDRARGLNTASYVSGYEGSPLAGYDLELARRKALLESLHIRHEPAVNEELATTAVQGSQLAAATATLRDGIDGVVGYWYGKAPGLDRAADAFRHANLAGTHGTGGAVAIVGDDPTAKSSSVPCSSEGLLADLGMPTLVPADSAETLKMGIHAAWMSRHCGLWTALRVTAEVADGNSTVYLDGSPVAPAPLSSDQAHQPDSRTLGPTLHKLEASRVGIRRQRALDYCRDHGINRVLHESPANKVGIIVSGAPALHVEQALRTANVGAEGDEQVRVLRLGMIWPLDAELVAEFAEGLDAILVVEEKGTFIYDSVRAALYDAFYQAAHRPEVTLAAKPQEGIAKFLTSNDIAHELPAKVARGPRPLTLNVSARTPHFCSGCPHNASTRASSDSLVSGGIGCHAMVLMMDTDRVGSVTGVAQMGGEGGHWIGMNQFVKEGHLIQNLGDGTFLHSGSLAIRALVAADANITVKLLHNGTVAMTGGQDPVGGQPLAGLIRILQAENVARIVVTTDDVRRTKRELTRGANTLRGSSSLRGVEVRDRSELGAVQEELAKVPGVTILVHDQACATELRRARKRGKAPTPEAKVVINERICEGCGDCGEKSGCLSVQPVDTEFGRKTRIDQTSCNLDYSCLKGDCPAFTLVTPDVEGAKALKRQLSERAIAELADLDIPAPEPADLTDDTSWNVRVTGVGGTGVVTLSAVIATAARLDGRFVRGLDMTGLAQKGGAVVSDVRISTELIDEPNTVSPGQADLLLACDGLTTADPKNLAVIAADRTTAVISSADSPTGVMCTDVKASRPNGVALAGAIGRSARRAVTMDAADISRSLFGDATYQTMVLLGAAAQAGALPISPESLELALTANGVAVDRNIAALRAGRLLVADEHALTVLVNKSENGDQPTAPTWALDMVTGTAELVGVPEPQQRSIALRISELAEWGDMEDAARYLGDVAVIASAEQLLRPRSTELLEAASFGLYKLTAYKDEYEVARLALASEFDDSVRSDFGAGAEVKFQLHPPMLRALGMDRKIGLGPKARPVLQALAKMKRLRGTKFDIFGMGKVRRLERTLATGYRSELLNQVRRMDADSFDDVVAFARMADDVRGYEDIKIANAQELLARI